MEKLSIDQVNENEDFKNQIGSPDCAIQYLTEYESGLDVKEDLDVRAYIYKNEDGDSFLLELFDDNEFYISSDITELQAKAAEWMHKTVSELI